MKDAGPVGLERLIDYSLNILWIISLFIAATKTCPKSSVMAKSRDVASKASTSSAAEESGISAV